MTDHAAAVPQGCASIPRSGAGSLAGFGRRALAITIDWMVALLISRMLLGESAWGTSAIFFVEQVLLIGTLGYTIGHRFLKVHVVIVESNRPPGLWPALVRTLLLLLVLPVLLVGQDGRGAHDRAAHTALIRR